MGQGDIAAAIARARDYLQANPHQARYEDPPATAVVEDGLRVRVDGPDGASVTTDMVPSVGGAGSAPSPGWLFRAAYASCVATLIAMRAAERKVTLTDLQVTVTSESDDRGILGMDDSTPPGPVGMRLRIRIASVSAGRDELTAIAEWGRAHCPVDDAAQRAIPVEAQITVG